MVYQYLQIISSIVWRISNIVSQAKVVEHQINGILISLKNKKELIEKRISVTYQYNISGFIDIKTY